jgi:phosphatidylglycerol:prolipoprotein diacylglycerol transferase
MLTYPNINPVILKIGPFSLRWYGLMYVVSFFVCFFLCRYQLKEKRKTELYPILEDFMFYAFLGVVIGARIGFCFFYYPQEFLAHPLKILEVWKGGMSFHGGLLGGTLVGYFYLKKKKQNLLFWADLIGVVAPICLIFGRIGNFINGEIFGKPSNLPWAMVFPAGGPVPRHPVQLYECLTTGLLLFLFLWFLRKKPLAPGRKFALFLMLYAVMRFGFEFLRVPAQTVPFLFGWMTMGQVLCVLMFFSGLILWIKTSKYKNSL